MMKKVIEVKDLSFSYPDGNQALAGVTFDIFKDETLAIIGPNGAGKSTLLLHLNGLFGNSNGVKIFEKPVTKDNLKFIRQQVGLVFQDPQDQLFMPTVYEDVAFGPKNLGLDEEKVEERVNDALGKVGLLEKKGFLSYHLSLGEQKRVSIATVLSMSCSILVLDEPNSNLDPGNRRNLINLLKDLPVTKIIATHDLEMVMDICERVVLLDHGRVISIGESREVLSNKELLQAHSLEVPQSLLCKRY
ncbi:MAG: ABC transporter ATP-binding protein [Candidatus Omnitrophica bacterium]|nr:ABC transporter ATP-binding protein [Candidatus Omnitrophota bacterium]